MSHFCATSTPCSTRSRGSSIPVRSLIMSKGDACQNRSCRSWRSSRRDFSSLACINFLGNSLRSSAGRVRVNVFPCICIFSSSGRSASVSSARGAPGASPNELLEGVDVARGAPGGSGTIACDGLCGTYVLDRIRRLISLIMSLPSVVILPIKEMTTLMSSVHRCLCSSVCVS